jgi:hypothetical protein
VPAFVTVVVAKVVVVTVAVVTIVVAGAVVVAVLAAPVVVVLVVLLTDPAAGIASVTATPAPASTQVVNKTASERLNLTALRSPHAGRQPWARGRRPAQAPRTRAESRV